MKFARIALLFVLFSLALTLMCGCTLSPHKETWYFHSYKDDMVFMNGVTINMGFSDASQAYPFAGVEHQNIGISFSKDGKVEFTAKDGITRYGTYTSDNEGVQYTTFIITLDNGEVIEGSAQSTVDGKKLALTYQGIIYNFTPDNNRSCITMDDVIFKILDGHYDGLSEANVIKEADQYQVWFSEVMYYPIKDTTAVMAIQINKNGTYEILDEVQEGKVLSTYNNKADYIVLYYVD